MQGLFLNDYILRRNRSIAKEARPAASGFRVEKRRSTNWRTFVFRRGVLAGKAL
jgi:hypothetical protein